MEILDGDAVNVAALAHARPAPDMWGRMRSAPEDFRVEERCDVALDDEGEHFWLWIEKNGLTTPQVVERLVASTGVSARDIGYSGLKDRHAVTRQWFSLAWPVRQPPPEWPDAADLRVLEARRHGRKLRRGTHRANRFEIVVRDVQGLDRAALDVRIEQIRRDGVPNYFGPQRFGRSGRNIELSRALFSGRRLSRDRRGFALSAARSLLFNAVLDARLTTGGWPAPLPGDIFMLAGSRSVFAAADTPESWESLTARAQTGDIEPTGPLPGRYRPGALQPTEEAGALERGVLDAWPEFVDGLDRWGVEAERRTLRLPVTGLEAAIEDGDVRFRFTLAAGAFATSVLRELIRVSDAAGAGPAS